MDIKIDEALISKLEAKPGDIFVLSFPQKITHEQKISVDEVWKRLVPGTRVLILSNGEKLSVLSASDAQTDEASGD